MLSFKGFLRTLLLLLAVGRPLFFRPLFFLFMLIVLRVTLFHVVEFAEGSSVFSAFLRHVGGKVRTISGTARFHFRDIFFGKTAWFFGMSLCNSLVLFFRFFLFEDCAANESVRFRLRSSFFMLGFDEVGSKSCNLILAQPVLGGVVFGFVRGLWLRRFSLANSIRRSDGLGFGSSLSEQPAGQPARKAAGNSGTRSV